MSFRMDAIYFDRRIVQVSFIFKLQRIFQKRPSVIIASSVSRLLRVALVAFVLFVPNYAKIGMFQTYSNILNLFASESNCKKLTDVDDRWPAWKLD